MTLWHVTPKENQVEIAKLGLVPKIGPRSAKMNEPHPAIYIFRNWADMENALMNWLGNELEDCDELVACRIELPGNFPVYETGDFCEVVTERPIPVDYISFENV